MRLKRWVKRNLDVLAFGAALASVGPLMAWWAVLVRRNILAMDQMARTAVGSLTPEARDAAFADIAARTDRQLFMISGESMLAGALFATLMVVLFAVARHRQNENLRLQTTLQLTSHQLKTPIAGMRMLLQSLEAGSIPQEMQANYLRQGVAEADRLEHLVETILAYQRAVVRHSTKKETVSTKALVDDILTHRARTFPDEKLALGTRSAAVVVCDSDAVRVVLENLLDNARKYGGGQVELNESLVRGRWCLDVRDMGQGFEPGDATRLFEPFERGGGPGVAHGSGLGLHIARQLARHMKGELSARSDGPGKGSTFRFELPLESAHG